MPKKSQKANDKQAETPKKTKSSRSCSWILTQDASRITFEDLQKALGSYVYVGQLERGKQGGEKGYKHYQIYIENPTQIRFDTLKSKLPNAHIEPRLGTRKQAYHYVTKEDTRIGDIFGQGDIDVTETQGKRNDIQEVIQMIKDGATDEELCATYPERYFKFYRNIDMLRQMYVKVSSKGWKKIKVIYISGETRSGKTRFVMEKHNPSDIYRTTEYDFGWIDGYRGEKVLVLDEYRSSLRISQILDYTDGYVERIHARNYSRCVCYDTVYIISNWKLHEQYPNVQKDKPEDWKAFLARIDDVWEFKNGVAIEVSKTKQSPELIPVDPDDLPF